MNFHCPVAILKRTVFQLIIITEEVHHTPIFGRRVALSGSKSNFRTRCPDCIDISTSFEINVSIVLNFDGRTRADIEPTATFEYCVGVREFECSALGNQKSTVIDGKGI